MTIGRLPESDITLPTAQVSRTHAHVVPTPTGPLLVDVSRQGIAINGERMQAPWVLADGDRISIGVSVLHVMQMGQEKRPEEVSPSPGGRVVRKVRTWLARYGWPEVMGTIAAVGAATGVYQLTGSNVVAAYTGTAAECVVFYGIIFLRESIRGAHVAGARGKVYGNTDLLRVLHGMMLEFGAAELLDSLVLRPLLIGQGMRLLHPGPGALAGKLAADLLFYGPVLSIYEWRLARGEAVKQEDRRRRTTEANRVV